MAAATAWRTWPALGSSERCSIDANKASAQTALVLGRYISSCIFSPLTGLPPALKTVGQALAGGVRLTGELHRPGTPRGLRTATDTPVPLRSLAPATDGTGRGHRARPGPQAGQSGLPPAFGPARGTAGHRARPSPISHSS